MLFIFDWWRTLKQSGGKIKLFYLVYSFTIILYSDQILHSYIKSQSLSVYMTLYYYGYYTSIVISSTTLCQVILEWYKNSHGLHIFLSFSCCWNVMFNWFPLHTGFKHEPIVHYWCFISLLDLVGNWKAIYICYNKWINNYRTGYADVPWH